MQKFHNTYTNIFLTKIEIPHFTNDEDLSASYSVLISAEISTRTFLRTYYVVPSFGKCGSGLKMEEPHYSLKFAFRNCSWNEFHRIDSRTTVAAKWIYISY